MVLMKNFDTILSSILAIASQKLVSRAVLPHKSIHINRDIFYDEMVLIFFDEHHCKTLCKKVVNQRLDGSLPANAVNDWRVPNAVKLKSTFCLSWNQQLFKNISFWNFQKKNPKQCQKIINVIVSYSKKITFQVKPLRSQLLMLHCVSRQYSLSWNIYPICCETNLSKQVNKLEAFAKYV